MNMLGLLAAGKRLMRNNQFENSIIYFSIALEAGKSQGWFDPKRTDGWEFDHEYGAGITEYHWFLPIGQVREIQSLLHFYRASAHMALENFSAACDDLHRTLALNDTFWPAHLALGFCHIVLKKCHNARHDLNTAELLLHHCKQKPFFTNDITRLRNRVNQQVDNLYENPM